MSFNSLLNKICTIQKVTETQDASNQLVKTWSNKYTGIKCRLDQNDGREQMGDNKILTQATHVLFLEFTVNVLVTDRVIVEGRTYNVLQVGDAGGHGHHRELLLEYKE